MDLKFLVLLFYYQRPTLVRDCLKSLQLQTYKNFEVAFIDDTEDPTQGRKAWEGHTGILGNYIHTQDTKEEKILRRGSMFGSFANRAMLDSNADVGIMLCDDDKLTPWYLEKLSEFYTYNPEVNTSYCDVIVHDALTDNWQDKLGEPASNHFLNANHEKHNMMNSKDSSQGSWRLKCVKEGGVRFNFPQTVAIDAYFYNDLFFKYGPASYNGIIGQVKSYSASQLGSHMGYDRVD